MNVDAGMILAAAWWLAFWTALGLCIGSFLNAVIYRIPRNRSLRRPVWSFCPHCKRPIHWYDNIPILSFVLLKGKCRRCGAFISTRYVAVEAMMALIVLMLLDAFFIGQARSGLADGQFGLTDQLGYDWPILIAHVVLFACLLSMSAIDLEHYWVDIRFTNVATIVGFVLHTLWTPRHSAQWVRPTDTAAVVSLFALIGLAAVWLWYVCRALTSAEAEDDPEPAPMDELDTQFDKSDAAFRAIFEPRSRVAGWATVLCLLATFAVLLADEMGLADLRHTGRALFALVVFAILVVAESSIPRPSDQLIADVIEEERPRARATVLSEMMMLSPAILAGAAAWWMMARGGELPDHIANALHTPLRGHWNPLMGFATAASGYIIAGALGWAIRIGFTLLFGKEAFGTGDIHLMAAAGCVVGWPLVVLGFFLTCFLATVGWVLTLPIKRTRALPLGPWLSLSFLAMVVFYNQVIEWPFIERAVQLGRMLLGAGGFGAAGLN